MKSSMSMDLALFSQKLASCRTLSIFLLMLKSAGTSCRTTRTSLHPKSPRTGTGARCQDSPRCGGSSGSCSSFPGAALLPWTWNRRQRLLQNPGSRRERFPRPSTHLNAAPRVLFFLTKAIRTRPSHSFQRGEEEVSVSYSVDSCRLAAQAKLTWKLMGGGGFFGSILTTLDSTLGGGRKLFFPT